MWRIWGQLCSRTLFDPTAPQKTGCLRLWAQITETEPKQKIKVNYMTFLSLNKEKKSKRWCFGWKKDNSAFLTAGQTSSKSISGLEMQKKLWIYQRKSVKKDGSTAQAAKEPLHACCTKPSFPPARQTELTSTRQTCTDGILIGQYQHLYAAVYKTAVVSSTEVTSYRLLCPENHHLNVIWLSCLY